MDKDRANEFLAKADKLLRWSVASFEEMQEYGKRGMTEDVERVFWALLAHISSLHDALESAASVLRPEWVKELNELRLTDPLLFYLWQARNSEVHNAVLKWHSASIMEVTIRDPAKATPIMRQFYLKRDHDAEMYRLMMYVYEVHTLADMIQLALNGVAPSPERIAAAGIEIKNPLKSLRLQDFKTRINGKTITVGYPGKHLGRDYERSDAALVSLAIEFYRGKLEELRVASARE